MLSQNRNMWLIIWSIIGGIGIILAILANVTGLYDRFFGKTPAKTILDLPIVKEYIFGNQYFYLQVLTDKSEHVLAYGVTTRDKEFGPHFKILDTDIILGKTRFGDLSYQPNNIFGYLGARRFYYHEEYYFGNPGQYQLYFLGVNDSGYIDINNENFDFFQKDKINPKDASVVNFRRSSVINTFYVTSPFGGFEEEAALRKYLVGPDLDQVRVISDIGIETKDLPSSLINQLKGLSTEVNIQFYFDRFGKPIIVNEHPYLEVRNDPTLNEQWDAESKASN